MRYRALTALGMVLLTLAAQAFDPATFATPASAPVDEATPAPATRYVTTQHRPDRVIAFKETPTRTLKQHVFLPPGWQANDERTGIVFFFGGGFVGGEPAQFFAKADYFARRGCVVICPDYRQRRLDGTTSESAVEDARSAMRWIRTHADTLGIHPARIVAGGGSAGGYLAAAVAWGSGPDADQDDRRVSTDPAALILYNPALSHFPVNETDGERADQLRQRMLPLRSPPATGPTAIIFYGTEDVWLRRSADALNRMRANAYPMEAWFAPGETHGFFNRANWHEVTLRQTDVFLTRLGLLEGEPTIDVPDPTLVLQPRPSAATK